MTSRGIIFDKDGTLFDFQATWAAWAVRVIDRLGERDPGREAALADALGFDRAAGRFRPDSVVIASPMQITAAAIHAVTGGDLGSVIDVARDLGTQTPQVEVPRLRQTIIDLAGSATLGVVTNDAEVSARTHLADAGILDVFAFVAGADSGHGAKPDPGPLLAFATATGTEPSKTFMVGDSTHDLHAARAAGMMAVGVLTGVASRTDLAPHADVVLDDIRGLAALLATDPASV